MTTRSPTTTPRLRYDKVAVRLVQGVRGALEKAVPDGLCVMFGVTAPIREPSKTLAALIDIIRARLSVSAAPDKYAATLCGNDVQVRIVASRMPFAARVAGFVHNPDPPSNALLDMAQSLLEGAEVPGSAMSRDATNLETLRHVCEQVFDAGGCAKVISAVRRHRARGD